MNTKQLIEALQKEDPEGTAEVMCGGDPVWFPERKPAWYDGVTHALKHDIDDSHISAYRIYRSGNPKLVLHTYSLEGFISDFGAKRIDISGLEGSFHYQEWKDIVDKIQADIEEDKKNE